MRPRLFRRRFAVQARQGAPKWLTARGHPQAALARKAEAAAAAASSAESSVGSDVGSDADRSELAPTRVLTSNTVWIGGIPDSAWMCPGADVDATFTESCARFGEVISATVRVKPGVRRSWALCTFREASAAQKCVGDGMVVVDVDGTEVQLKCKVRIAHKIV